MELQVYYVLIGWEVTGVVNIEMCVCSDTMLMYTYLVAVHGSTT